MPAKSAPKLLSVFLCYAPTDIEVVREIYRKLKSEGWIDPWLDEEKIDGGKNVNLEISTAVDEICQAAIIFLSKRSMVEEGRIHKYLRAILKEAQEEPERAVYLLPLRVEECPLPKSIEEIQPFNYFPKQNKKKAYDKLLKSLELKAELLGIKTRKASKRTTSPSGRSSRANTGSGKKTNADLNPRLEISDTSGTSLKMLTPDGHKIYPYGDMQFVKVPAGTFLMGSKRQNLLAHKDEFFQWPYDVQYDYMIGRFPVTVSEYGNFTYPNGLEHEFGDDEDKLLNHPVTCVSWDRAKDFCKWLNGQYADQLPVVSGVKFVFRLPTELEWEKAARGRKGFEWPWGDKFDKNKCNCYEGGVLTTTPVGRYSAKGGDSPYGAADMAGNVWEWTNTIYKLYPYIPGDGREVKQGKGQACVVRGGCYRDQQRYLRTCYRYMIPNSSLYYFQGFRVVVAPPVVDTLNLIHRNTKILR